MNESKRRVVITLTSPTMPMDQLGDLADHVGRAVAPIVRKLVSECMATRQVRDSISFEVAGERWVPADAKADIMQQNLDEIARICGLAGIGSEGQSYVDRVAELYERLLRAEAVPIATEKQP